MSWEGGHSTSFFGEQDEQLTQKDVILVKFILIIWFMISLNYTLDWLQTFNFVQFCPWRTSILAPDFNVFFKIVFGLGFLQFNP
jgi:hypothetical protein